MIRRLFRIKRLTRLCLWAWLIWLALPNTELYPPGLEFSQRVIDRDGNDLRITLTGDEKFRIFTQLDAISPRLVEATLLHEDQYFRRHPGVNPFSVARAALGFGNRGGASTISMQLARMRFGIESRSITGKLVQMFRAVQLERHYTKDEILEAYLNLAPYGGNIEGIGAASALYLQKSPDDLTRREAVALSVIPQSPAKRTPPRDGSINPHLAAAQARLFQRLREGAPDPLDAQFSIRRLDNLPFEAPHLAQQLLDRFPDDILIHSTLDSQRQSVLESSASNYVRRKQDLGIENAAALLIDHRTMEVLAYLGSADFKDVEIDGQVDGVQMRRSPGSTLKPFIYGMAIDQGLIHPNTLINDSRKRFSDYTPENFDRGFLGPIAAGEALRRSRNVPAVQLTAMLEEPDLHEFLTDAGLHLPHDADYYGLTLALGGSEASLVDLTRLYAMLANHGRMQPLVFTDAERGNSDHETRDANAQQLLSREAAFMTLSMIENIPAPGLARQMGNSNERPVYWKTGTSHGFRDAWAAAVFDRYVLAVWIGNFSGEGNASFVARDATAPLLFDMIASLRGLDPDAPAYIALPAPGANVRRVQLCSVSGQMPRECCKKHRSGWFVPGVSPIQRCGVHQEIPIDVASGLRLSPADLDGVREIRREVYEFWPTDLLKQFEKAGLSRRRPPPFHPDSVAAENEASLAIVSPVEDEVYTLQGANTRVPLRVNAAADAQEIFWFAGREFLGATPPETPLFWEDAISGTHRISAVDDRGRRGERTVQVRRF
ncbi:MAG: penicillin-binding protein 1C [Verrucomicrobiales bacterium]|jgi:penicillin-binding protein 1C